MGVSFDAATKQSDAAMMQPIKAAISPEAITFLASMTLSLKIPLRILNDLNRAFSRILGTHNKTNILLNQHF